jgi:hypothetical protein
MALVRKRYKCPLCELAVCGSCFNQKIQLDPVIFTDLPSTHHQPPPLFRFRFNTRLIARARTLSVTEVICKACYALVQEEEERATIAKYVAGLEVGGGEGGNSSCRVCRARRSWTTRVRCGGR